MRRLGKVLTVIATLALLSFPFIVWWKAQALVDWWALRNYTPPPAIVALARAGTMTPHAEHIFYVNHPELIDDVAEFREQCPQNEHTIVLGCYHSRQQGIDIYNVEDERLDGVEEVTASHEMLHAAYDRLSSKEKREVNSALQDYYAKNLSDKRIRGALETYRDLQPDEVVNEMHSIFATEVAELPTELENYYSRYFENRAAVVSLAEGYESEFSRRLAAIENYDKQLADMKEEIDSQTEALNRQRNSLEADRRRLDSLRSSGQISAYNASVREYNSKVNAYNAAVAQLRRDIEYFNELVEQRNAVASELRSLDSALDTRIVPERVE